MVLATSSPSLPSTGMKPNTMPPIWPSIWLWNTLRTSTLGSPPPLLPLPNQWNGILPSISLSACKTLCKDIEQISFSWEISEKASLTSPSSWPLVNFDALTMTSIDNPPASQPILSTAIPDAHLHQALASDSSVATTSSTQLLAHELQAKILALTCCLLCRVGLQRERAESVEECTEVGKGLDDFHLKGGKIRQSATIMVMMCITDNDHWIHYVKCYVGGSTGIGRGVNDGVRVKISQICLNYDVVGCQGRALRVGSTGE